MNLSAMQPCLTAGDKRKVIQEYTKQADKRGIRGTPYFIINDEVQIPGLLPEPKMREIIQDLIQANS